jgi:hypothetical protein
MTIDAKELHFTLRVIVPAEAPNDMVMLKLQQLLSMSGFPLLLQSALFEIETPDKENIN